MNSLSDGDKSFKTPKSLFGVGSWMRVNRYENDEFSLSPPSSEDAGFLHYQFGSTRNTPKPTESMFDRINNGSTRNTPKPTESMFDRINKELNLSVETPKKEVTRENFDIGLNLFGAAKVVPRPDSKTKTELPHFTQQDKEVPRPRIIIPPTILEKGESLRSTDLSQEISLEILKSRPEFSRVAFEDAETLVRKARSGRPTRKISLDLSTTIDRSALITNFQHLDLENSHPSPTTATIPDFENLKEDEQIPATTRTRQRSLSPGSAIQSPFITSLAIPQGIKDRRRRKISAPPCLNPMEPTSNFFFTGGLFSSVQTTKASTLDSSEAPQSLGLKNNSPSTVDAHSNKSLSHPGSPMKNLRKIQVTTAEATAKMETRDNHDAAMEPKPKIGRRRPKPSSLREMNFWAPQSS